MIALFISPAIRAQNIESVLMPGKVIQGHAKLEGQCSNCHVRFNPSGQVRLCLDCHKNVAADVRARTGYHGRLKDQTCRSCHTDHKGRDARIVRLDESRFDHSQTDYLLKGRHTTTKCSSCHNKTAKYNAAPHDCNSCHRKDDKHKGKLGTLCESCHNPQSWKDARFDHTKTTFPLTNKHAQVKCDSCHVEGRFANTPKACVSCHKKDDTHRGRFGTRCESCHNDASWKHPTFRHERETHFALRGAHALISCNSCHRTDIFREKLPTSCVGCHRSDDAHKGALGDRCESCHSERKWNQPKFDHDRDANFPLRAKHRDAKCESCHINGSYKEKPPTKCVSCHLEDDRKKGHKGNFGDRCNTCHSEKGWSTTTFDHNRDTHFVLREKHIQVKCVSCHSAPLYKQKTEDKCVSCHRKTDPHKGKLGDDCDKCHSERSWKQAKFDHDKDTVFKLEGAHKNPTCNACHNPADKEKFTLGKNCIDCHRKDDVHFESYGKECKTCHLITKWTEVTRRPRDDNWPQSLK